MTRHLLAWTAALALAAPATALAGAPQVGVPRSPASSNVPFSQGYQRGLTAGVEDGRRGDRFNYSDEADYRRADNGYRGDLGNRTWFRDEFRRGFESGYRDGYRRVNDRSSWSSGRGRQQRDLAWANGFDDGYEAGVKDVRGRRQFDPAGEGRFKSGDHGYERWYGSRELYRTNYREAFRDGYVSGYRQAR